MADNEALILGEIQDKYVPFLKKLIAFLEKNKKVTPDNLNRLKSIYTVFTTSSISEQIQVFNTNKKKLEKWYKNPKKDKMTDDSEGSSTQGSKRSFMEDTDSSQGAPDAAPSKRSRTEASSSTEKTTFNPAVVSQIKKEKAEASKAATKPVANVAPTPATAAAATPPPSNVNDNGELIFTCASCQYQSLDEQEFMKHTRTDHRSDLSMWCKQCGKCFSNAGVLVSHIKERACTREEMIYRCGVKECTFETTSGQTFVHHLRHCHKGSPFIFCVHCQKIFTLPHCLILHMQDDCPYKERNRRNPGAAPSTSRAPATTPAVTAPKPVPSFTPRTPTIASVTSGIRPSTPVVISSVTVASRGRGGLTPSVRGRGGLTPSRVRGRGRGRGGRGRPPSESSDSDDPDDPSWKPEELAGQSMLRRSGRFAKKVNDVINVVPKSTDKHFPSEELNAKEMIKCPCCDYTAAFKSVLEDHYIAQHKVPNKNACLVCHLKFESTQGFMEHFVDHVNGKLPNSAPSGSPITVQEDSNIRAEPAVEKVSELQVAEVIVNAQPVKKVVLDEDLVQGVVKNISEANVIDPTSDETNFIKIPYQAAIHDKSSKDAKLKKFEELKSPNDLVTMRSVDNLKCFYKCVMYGCTFTSNDGEKFMTHLDAMHKGKRLHCNYCLKDFYCGDTVVKHMMAEHSNRVYQCNNCFYRACSIKHLKAHIQHSHTNDTNVEILTCDPVKVADDVTVSGEPTENTTWPYICAIGECVYQSFDPKEFKIHNEMVHRTVSVFFCHYCKVDFISFKRLLNHYRLHGINTLQCNYCIHGAETKEDILLHLCNSHADFPMRAFKRGLPEENTASASLSSNNDAAKINYTSVDSPRSESPSVENTQNNHIDFEAQLYEVVGETYYPKYLKAMATDFVCGVPFCPEKFEGMLTYIGHLSNCHAAVNFPCPHCPHISDDWDNFKNHLMCHGSELFACGLMTCNFYDWDKTVVAEHVKSHSQSTAKVVIVREESFKDTEVDKIKSLPQSYSAKLSSTSYQCLFCKYKSREKSIMKNHLYSELMYKRFNCSTCNEKCISREEIKEHYIAQHSDQEIKCSVHPNPTIENAVQQFLNLNRELPETVTDRCIHCKKNFKTVIHLQRHLYLCTRKHYQPYDCNYCMRSFHDAKILKFHIDEKHFSKPLVYSIVSSLLVEEELALKLQHARLKYLKDAVEKDNPPPDSLPICFVKYYACGLCSYESNHKHNTQIHMKHSHDGAKIEIRKTLRNVDMPDLTNSQFAEAPKQDLASSSGKTKPYRCYFCIKKLHSIEELEKHVEAVHSVGDESEYMFYYSPDLATCTASGENKQYECSYCKSGKDSLSALKKHSDLMHSESPFRVRGYIIRNPASNTLACAYCYQRMDNLADLKQHTASLHPNLIQKSIGGFKSTPTKRSNEDPDDLPNKRVRFSSLIFVCSHCGAAYSSKDQVVAHSKKGHTRLQQEFTMISVEEDGEKRFYKCEFCQFTSEQDFLDMHLKTKHKNRVTCSHCSKRFEFASKLKEHHDAAHKGMPVKYSQETLPFIKKEPEDNLDITHNGSDSKAMKTKQSSAKRDIYVWTDGISDNPCKLLLSTFSKIYNISPKVLLNKQDIK